MPRDLKADFNLGLIVSREVVHEDGANVGGAPQLSWLHHHA